MKTKKLASLLLEEKIEKISFSEKAKNTTSFNIKKFQHDAKKVRDTFEEKDNGDTLPQRNYI